uniref:Probable membrane transporter protein n=1 Tax=Archaeoglobus fulgidus TaxID=2234 RepID=A0A7J2TIJ2_ARCFL
MVEIILFSLVALLIAFFTSPAGLSGAFLLLPFQVSVLGFTSPSVSATNLVYNLIAIPGGVYRYVREKRMAWPIAAITILGTIPGIFIGATLRSSYFLDPKLFKLFVGLVLLYLGLRVLISVLRPNQKMIELERKFKERANAVEKEKKIASGLPEDAVVKTRRVGIRRVEYEFWGEIFSFSPVAIFIISLLIGIIGGIYGIGGGAILAPILASFFGLPIYTVAGATLLGTLLTSIFGIFSYYLLGYPPEWKIGLSFGVGGFIGMYLGARFQKFMPEKIIRLFLSTLVLMISANYVAQFFV